MTFLSQKAPSCQCPCVGYFLYLNLIMGAICRLLPGATIATHQVICLQREKCRKNYGSQGTGLDGGVQWGTTYAANLRILINALTEDQWVKTARTLKAKPPMPWFDVNIMKTEDLKALYQFIRSMGASGEPAPAYLPPDQEPTTPYALFPSPPKQGGAK